MRMSLGGRAEARKTAVDGDAGTCPETGPGTGSKLISTSHNDWIKEI